MAMFLIRLDDASDKMDVDKWNRIEKLLDKYKIKPIVGIIPSNKDPECAKFNVDKLFWNKAQKWEKKRWTIAMHGFEHVYETMNGGLNPIQQRSEFAGLPLDVQCKKIKMGYELLKSKNINPRIFFAPSHTFDINTLKALKNETNINIISDTIANDIYYENNFYFIPQQSGCVRNLHLKVVTFCYHPNSMNDVDYVKLEKFIKKYRKKFISFDDLTLKKRKITLYDKLLKLIYFIRK